MLEYGVTAEENGWRVQDVLRKKLKISYTALQSAKWHDRVLLNGESVHANTLVHAGDIAAFLPAEAEPVRLPEPYSFPIRTLYRDEHLLIVDKPAPMASQCGKTNEGHTLENAMFSFLGCPDDFIFRPVNRLDRGTSGLMALAMNAHMQQLMQRILHTRDFRRIYLAVTDGFPPQESGVIDAPITKEDAASVRRVVSEDGKPSVTHYEVLRRDAGSGRALVRLELETGRTHQIRVHLAHLGCPVFGDFLYGKESPLLPGRFALHSSELILLHPLSGEQIHLTSPLPDEISALLR